MIVVNYKGEDKQFAVEVISSMVFMKMCEIQLPSIVVVSDQFFGKSNVLEYLAGISLPHDQGNCIRVPLDMRLCNPPIPTPELVLEFYGKAISLTNQRETTLL